jgi:tetratricopeptide (TPR) repeat protein
LQTPESRRDVACSLDKVAGIEHARGDLDAALAKYEDALAIRRALADELETPQSRRDLAWTLQRIGSVLAENGDSAESLKHHEEALDLRIRILRTVEPPEESAKDDVLWAMRNVRDAAGSAEQPERAFAVASDLLTRTQAAHDIARSPRQTEACLRDVLVFLDIADDLGRPALDEWAPIAQRLAGQLEAAFDDPEVDRDEHALDATSLRLCADAWLLPIESRASESRERAAGLQLRAMEILLEEHCPEDESLAAAVRQIAMAHCDLSAVPLSELQILPDETTEDEVETVMEALEALGLSLFDEDEEGDAGGSPS